MMESEQRSTAEPTKEGKSTHTLSHKAVERNARRELPACRRPKKQTGKPNRGRQRRETGTLQPHWCPISKARVLPQTHVSELCALQHQRGVLCSPRSMNRAAMNVNAEPAGAAGRGRGRSDPWELPPGHHGAFHLVRSMDMARGVLQPLWSCVRPGKDPSCLEERPSSTDRPAEE